MSDVLCAKCGEPWDSSTNGPHDMPLHEKEKFNRGEGCICCGWGKHCPLCDGSGKDDGSNCCSTCRDKGYILAWSPNQDTNTGYKVGRHYMGYMPNVRALSEEDGIRALTLGQRKFPERIRSFVTADGGATEWWLVCPDCKGENEGLPCERCEGSGELDVDPDLEAARTAMEASDEDGLDILERRGLI